MEREMKKINSIGSATHVAVLSVVGILAVTLVFTAISRQGNMAASVLGDERSESSTSSEEQKSEVSTESVDEQDEPSTEMSEQSEELSISEQEPSEMSEPSEVSTNSVQDTFSTDSQNTSLDEDSEVEVSEVSVQSETIEESEISEVDELSSVTVDDFDNVVELENNVVLVTRNERLFFLIPVDIESTLQLDEEGNVVSTQQSLLYRLLSIFSF